MSNNPVIVNEEYLQDIADAIRAKNGGSTLYTPADMATAISNITTNTNFDWLDYARNGGGWRSWNNLGTQNPGKFFWSGTLYQQSATITVGRTSSSTHQWYILIFNPSRLKYAKQYNQEYVALTKILCSSVSSNQFVSIGGPSNGNSYNTSCWYVKTADVDNNTVNATSWDTLNSAILYKTDNGTSFSQVGGMYNQGIITLFGPDFPIQHNSTPLW